MASDGPGQDIARLTDMSESLRGVNTLPAKSVAAASVTPLMGKPQSVRNAQTGAGPAIPESTSAGYRDP